MGDLKSCHIRIQHRGDVFAERLKGFGFRSSQRPQRLP